MPTIYIDNKEALPERKAFDFYPTPVELCRSAVNQILPKDFSPTVALDPGYGTGVWGLALKERYKEVLLIGKEIRDVEPQFEVYDIWSQGDSGDFMKVNYAMVGEGYDLILGNPPYNLAEEFLDKSFSLVYDGGYILFLFKLSVLEGQHRFKKYYGNGLNPKEVWVSTRRVSFTGNKKSNSDAYACYLWQKGYVGNTTLNWLDWSYE